MRHSIVTLVVGMLAGIVFVFACGDDGPTPADAQADAPNVDAPAATCDCPAAEPPLAGRITVVNVLQTIPGTDRGGQTAVCPEGAIRLSGSCTAGDLATIRNVTLQQSGYYGIGDEFRAWHCEFRNNEATPVVIKASVTCLIPAP